MGLLSRHIKHGASPFLGDALSFPGLPDHRRAQPIFLIYRLPSFLPCSSWTLLEVGGVWKVRRIVEALPASALSHERHTFGSEMDFAGRLAENLIDAFGALKLSPPPRSNSVGIDGTCYGIRFMDNMSSMELSWWHKAADGFRELPVFLERAIDEFEAVLPASICSLGGPPWVVPA